MQEQSSEPNAPEKKALSHFPKALFTVGHTFDLIPTAFSFAPCKMLIWAFTCDLHNLWVNNKMLILQQYHHITLDIEFTALPLLGSSSYDISEASLFLFG